MKFCTDHEVVIHDGPDATDDQLEVAVAHADCTLEDMAAPDGDLADVVEGADLAAELEQMRRERDAALAAAAAANDEAARARAEAERHSPYTPAPVFDKPEDVIEFYGAEVMRAKAEAQMAAENKRRQKQGLPPLYSMASADLDRLIEKTIMDIATKIVRSRDRWVPDAWQDRVKMRMLKVIFPVRREDNPREWTWDMAQGASMRQLPLEAQINNAAGSIADGVLKYRNKGAKIVSPFLCLLFDCYRPAALDEAGNPVHGLYCSQDHHQFVEGSTAAGANAGTAGERVLLHSAGYSMGQAPIASTMRGA